jgi:hypothetical protein
MGVGRDNNEYEVCFWEEENVLELGRWFHDIVNVLNVAEFYTIK